MAVAPTATPLSVVRDCDASTTKLRSAELFHRGRIIPSWRTERYTAGRIDLAPTCLTAHHQMGRSLSLIFGTVGTGARA